MERRRGTVASHPPSREGLHGSLLLIVVVSAAVLGLAYGLPPLVIGVSDNSDPLVPPRVSLTVIFLSTATGHTQKVRSWAYWRGVVIATASMVLGALLATNLLPQPLTPSWLALAAYHVLTSALSLALFLVAMEHWLRLGLWRIAALILLLSVVDGVLRASFGLLFHSTP